jgi:molecular chaperone GrpE
LAEGVRLVHQNLLKVLEAHHVERIESLGQPFDPSCHEAMMQQPTDEHPPGTVVEEYQPGYKLWDRVVRPAKVIVAQGPSSSEPEAAGKGQVADEPNAAEAPPDKE